MAGADKKIEITRQVEFAAAHRLFRADWSAEKNAEVFGPCANPHGHGHNYLLEATFSGPVDPQTGMVVHFASLKRLLEETVVQPLDHRHLNHDVPFLADVLPSSENIVMRLWDRIQHTLRDEPWQLVKLRLASSARNWVEYRG
jgi:6-pyruvoyltetrahydropterin/6-carboxytetrahydropterin synthase